MNNFSLSEVRSWLKSNGMKKAIACFDEGLKKIESLLNDPASIGEKELYIIVNCRDPEKWIGASLAGMLSGKCVCFLPCNLPGNHVKLFLSFMPGACLVYDESWRAVQGANPSRISAEHLQDGKILIPTGGSSGNTKFAIHELDTLTAAVKGVSEQFFGCGHENTAFNYCCDLPLWHVSGWMQVMRSCLSGGQFYLGKSARKRWIQLHSGRFLSLVPTQLRRMLFDAEELKILRAADTIVVGGGPCPVSILEACLEEGIFPWVTYGMTETLGMIAGKQIKCRDDLNVPAMVFPHASVQIVHNERQEIHEDVRGEILVESSALCKGYVFISAQGWKVDYRVHNFLSTRDLGSLDCDGNLHVWGRMDHLIITGGEKVNPREVEAAIEQHPGVVDAFVGSLPDEKWGQQVICIYVTKQGMNATAPELQAFLGERLEPFKIPKSWSRAESLPYDHKGKLPAHRMEELIREVFA